MKKLRLKLGFVAIIIGQLSIAQLDFSMSGLYSSPLNQFCIDDYKDGWGAKFGVGYTEMFTGNSGIEFGFNWLLNNSGTRITELPIGDYTLRNDWYNWQFKLNGVWEQGVFRHYAGINVGRAHYYTSGRFGLSETQEDDSDYWNDTFYRQRIFQYGAQVGTYIKFNDVISFDLGMSVLRSEEAVKYVNFESYTIDGELIDYQEPNSSPFLVTISAGFRFNLSNMNFGSSSTSTSSNNYEYEGSDFKYDTQVQILKEVVGVLYSLNSSSSSRSSNSRSSLRSKGSRSPKLYKNGKTPVNYK